MGVKMWNIRTCISQPVTQACDLHTSGSSQKQACNLHTSGTTTENNNNREQQQRTTTENNIREQQQEIIKKINFYSHDLTYSL